MCIIVNITRIFQHAVAQVAKLADSLTRRRFSLRGRQVGHGADQFDLPWDRHAEAIDEGNLDATGNSVKVHCANRLPAFIRDGERVVAWGTRK